MENSVEVPLKTENRATMWCSNPTPATVFVEKKGAQKDADTPVFIAALRTITKTWKQLKFLLMDEWI